MRIALIHATPLAMAPVTDALRRHWPDAEPMHLLDDRLSVDRAHGVDAAEIDRRILTLAEYVRTAGAAGILFTCSAFGHAIEKAAAALDCPVMKPNEAMFREALAYGTHLGLLASFKPSLAPMQTEFAEVSDHCLTVACAPEAMVALAAGNKARHDRLLAEAAADLKDCQAIMLAQFSTARARPSVAATTGLPVLTSPDSAVLAMKAMLD